MNIDDIIKKARRDSRCVSGAETRALCDEIERLRIDPHCVDCCCSRSWAALGITEYTGKSIPEEITQLRAQLAACQAKVERLQTAMDRYAKHDSLCQHVMWSNEVCSCGLWEAVGREAARAAGGGEHE